MEKNDKTVVFFMVLLTIAAAFSIIFVLPVLKSKVLAIVWLVINVMVLMSFLLSVIIDPGFVTKDDKYDFQELLNEIDPVYLCPDCSVLRTPRSRHCNLCNRCVERYDHHCPYINN